MTVSISIQNFRLLKYLESFYVGGCSSTKYYWYNIENIKKNISNTLISLISSWFSFEFIKTLMQLVTSKNACMYLFIFLTHSPSCNTAVLCSLTFLCYSWGHFSKYILTASNAIWYMIWPYDFLKPFNGSLTRIYILVWCFQYYNNIYLAY